MLYIIKNYAKQNFEMTSVIFLVIYIVLTK